MEPIFEQYGELRLPLDPADFRTSLVALDPARDRLLGLFAAAINAEFGAVWTQVVGALPAGNYLSGSSPVMTLLPMSPDLSLMQQSKLSFPILAFHRNGSVEFEARTMQIDAAKQEWQLHYILGPGSAEIERKLLDVCVALGRVLQTVIRKRGHSAWEGGALQFFGGVGSLESIQLMSQEGPGKAAFSADSSVIYWAATWKFEISEISGERVDHLPTLAGISSTANVSGSEGTLPDVSAGNSHP